MLIPVEVLLELLLENRSEVLGNLESFNGNANSRNALSRSSVHRVLGNAFLDSDVVGVLREEVRHGGGVLGLQLLDVLLVINLPGLIHSYLLWI